MRWLRTSGAGLLLFSAIEVADPAAALRVERLTSTGGLPPHIAGTFEQPINFQQAPSGAYYVLDRRAQTVYTVDASGKLWVSLTVPYTYVYDADGDKVRTVQFAGAGTISPTSLFFTRDGRLLVTPGCYEFDPD